MADAQDTPAVKIKQNEKAVKVDNQEMLTGDRTEVDADGKSLNDEMVNPSTKKDNDEVKLKN